MADALRERLGDAELVWSRVSREPRATFAARPGTRNLRWPMQTSREHVYLAGAWTASDWPATMEAPSQRRRRRAGVRTPLADGDKRRCRCA